MRYSMSMARAFLNSPAACANCSEQSGWEVPAKIATTRKSKTF